MNWANCALQKFETMEHAYQLESDGLVEKLVPVKDERYIDWNDDVFKDIMKFLAIPAVFAICVLVLQIIPRFGMYAFAAVYGLMLISRSLKNPEYLMACFVFYIPLSSMIPVSLGPGINATNLFIFALIGIAFITRKPALQPLDSDNFDPDSIGVLPAVKRGVRSPLIKFFFLFSAFSGVTAIIANGVGHIVSDHLLTYKGWVDQTLFVLIFATLIKDSPRAVRLAVYMMMAHVVVAILGLQEAFDKSGLSSIDKARVSGTIGNPNDFGAFIVYTSAPFIGMCLASLPNLIRTAPYALGVLLMLRVMLATFSRGAYVALAAGILAASYVRGIGFSLLAGALALTVVLLFPSVVPNSIMDRLGLGDQEHVSLDAAPELDKSSTMRFVMWSGATQMTLESPIFGKGFKMFQNLIGEYAGVPIEIADPHNMYFYISSQMGLPALFAFIFLWILLFFRSSYIFHHVDQHFVRGVALAGAVVAGSVAAFNMFGSRMVSIETSGFAYLYVLIINRIWQDLREIEMRNSRPMEFEW